MSQQQPVWILTEGENKRKGVNLEIKVMTSGLEMLGIRGIYRTPKGMCLRHNCFYVLGQRFTLEVTNFGVISKKMVGKATNFDMVNQKEQGTKREMSQG